MPLQKVKVSREKWFNFAAISALTVAAGWIWTRYEQNEKRCSPLLRLALLRMKSSERLREIIGENINYSEKRIAGSTSVHRKQTHIKAEVCGSKGTADVAFDARLAGYDWKIDTIFITPQSAAFSDDAVSRKLVLRDA